jgi:surface antigen
MAALGLGAIAMTSTAQPYDDDARYHYDGCRGDRAVGTGVGAVLGGVIGNQFGSGSGRTAATIGGVILGGIAGNAIARDACRDRRADAYYYNRAYVDAFEDDDFGRAYRWDNPYTGSYGTVTPVREYYDDDGGVCREFQQTVYIDGHRAEAYGVACREGDGSWRIVNS